MKDYVKEQVHRYFGNGLPKLALLGITKYAVYTYVSRVYEDRSKESAMNGQGMRLDPAQIEFVWSVLDRLPREEREPPSEFSQHLPQAY